MVSRCAESLKDTYEQIRLKMITLGLIHCDETGSRVDGKICWVHVASDLDYTYLTINQRRGQIGMDAANVLPHAHGIIVHDCWSSYWKYQDVTHAICCAHLLRELNGVIENHPEQTWAVRFKNLLLSMKKVHDKALLSDEMRSATITAINLIRSIIPLSKLHMRKIPFLKFLLKNTVARKRAKY